MYSIFSAVVGVSAVASVVTSNEGGIINVGDNSNIGGQEIATGFSHHTRLLKPSQ